MHAGSTGRAARRQPDRAQKARKREGNYETRQLPRTDRLVHCAIPRTHGVRAERQLSFLPPASERLSILQQEGDERRERRTREARSHAMYAHIQDSMLHTRERGAATESARGLRPPRPLSRFPALSLFLVQAKRGRASRVPLTLCRGHLSSSPPLLACLLVLRSSRLSISFLSERALPRPARARYLHIWTARPETQENGRPYIFYLGRATHACHGNGAPPERLARFGCACQGDRSCFRSISTDDFHSEAVTVGSNRLMEE